MAEISNNNVIGQLQELGLTHHEALIYLAVLKHGESSAGVILDEVKLHREQVYRALKRLVDQGLLTSYEKRKRNYYSAVDPTVLVNQVKSKVAVAESLKPYLTNLHQKKPQIIKVVEGEEAIRSELEDMIQFIEPGGEYLVLGGVGQTFYQAAEKFIPEFEKKFKKKNIKGRIIVYEGSEYPKNLPFGENLSIIKRIRKSSDFPVSTVIYGNKVVIWLNDPDNIAVVSIENEKIADSYRQTFEALWR